MILKPFSIFDDFIYAREFYQRSLKFQIRVNVNFPYISLLVFLGPIDVHNDNPVFQFDDFGSGRSRYVIHWPNNSKLNGKHELFVKNEKKIWIYINTSYINLHSKRTIVYNKIKDS